MFELAKYVPIALLNLKDIEIEVSGRQAKVRLPDLIVLSEEGYATLQGKTRNIVTREMPPPILIVEVVSPGNENRTRDYRHKRTEYWIIDPEERRITVCEWVDGQYEDTVFVGETRIESTVISGFELTAEQIFAFAQT